MLRVIFRRWFIAVSLVALAGCETQTPATLVPTLTSSATSGPAATASATPAATLSIPGSVWVLAQPPLPPGSTLPLADGSVDYLDLWRADAPWPKAAARVDVFEIASSWVMNLAAPADLRQVVTGVASRGMKLALSIGAFSAGQEGCGFGVEGFDAGLEPLWKVRDAGGHVDFIVFDEPYAFGVRDRSANACQWSLEEAAQHAVWFVNQVRDYDATIVIGGDEPLWAGTSASDIGGWLDAYAAATGKPYAFLHLDTDWSLADWPAILLDTGREAEARGVPVAFIYNGGDTATSDATTSDAEWVDFALQRAHLIEEILGGHPDHTALESWMDHPDHMLPESDPTTFSGFINRYFAPRTSLDLEAAESRAAGALDIEAQLSVKDAGGGIGGADVRALIRPLDGSYQILTLDGVVPAGASRAGPGIRVNFEGAGPGKVDLRLYGFSYSEGGSTRNPIANPAFKNGFEGWGLEGTGRATVVGSDEGTGNMVRLRASAAEWIAINGPGFAVTPGSRYHFEVAAKVPQDSATGAYATVMFLSGPAEIGRHRLALAPAAVDAGTVATGGGGHAHFTLTDLASGRYAIRLEYAGDLDHWPAVAEGSATVR